MIVSNSLRTDGSKSTRCDGGNHRREVHVVTNEGRVDGERRSSSSRKNQTQEESIEIMP
jgi:hypothetical protein